MLGYCTQNKRSVSLLKCRSLFSPSYWHSCYNNHFIWQIWASVTNFENNLHKHIHWAWGGSLTIMIKEQIPHLEKHQKLNSGNTTYLFWNELMNTKTFELAGVFTNALSTHEIWKMLLQNWAEIENAEQKSAELYTGAMRSMEDCWLNWSFHAVPDDPW